jgi:hypothetical protein
MSAAQDRSQGVRFRRQIHGAVVYVFAGFHLIASPVGSSACAIDAPEVLPIRRAIFASAT